jgi:phosphonate transport system substrate-binding protein
MSKNSSNWQIFVLALAGAMLLGGCGPQAAPAAGGAPGSTPTSDQVISIGIISGDPAGDTAAYQPLMNYLAAHMADLGIRQGQVVVEPDFDSMDAKIKSGEVDLFYETGYGALYTYQHAGTIPFLRGWKGGLSEYHSTFFVRRDSGITSLDGLRGHLLAFAEPDSTSGYFLPKAYLLASGYNIIAESTASMVPSGQIGYVSSGSDSNVVTYVLNGTAVGGALEYDTFDALQQSDKDQLTVLAQSQDIPRSFMMVSSAMSPAMRQRVSSLLKGAAQTADGQAALASAGGTKQFDDFPLGPDATIQMIQTLFAPIQ